MAGRRSRCNATLRPPCPPHRAPACRWQLLADVLFSEEWAQLVAAGGPWSRLWMPDDDVLASACDIARLFWAMGAAHLQLAQVRVSRVLRQPGRLTCRCSAGAHADENQPMSGYPVV